MELFRRTVRIVDDVVLFQSGDARRVKPDAHYERPEDEHDHWRGGWDSAMLIHRIAGARA